MEHVLLLRSGESFSQRIHERDLAFFIGHDHRVSDALQNGGQPLLSFSVLNLHLIFVKGNFDTCLELSFFEWFDDITERLGFFGPIHRLFIDKGCDVHDRDIEVLVYPVGGFDTVDFSFEHDIHQHEVGHEFLSLFDGLLAGAQDFKDIIPQYQKHVFDVTGDDAFVLDEQNFSLIHMSSFCFFTAWPCIDVLPLSRDQDVASKPEECIYPSE